MSNRNVLSQTISTVLCAALIVLSNYMSAAAGTTGKISGTVIDKSNGQGLPGANVVLVGTIKGASSDLKGGFKILNVEPGTYQLEISMMGYREITIENVRVSVDLTTHIDLEMTAGILEIREAVVVTAERPLVQKDLTMKQTTLYASDISDMPLNDIPKILATLSNVSVLTGTPTAKAGYNVRGIDDIRMRGGRNNEVALLIDGVKVQNPLFGGFGTKLNTNAVEQLTISAGGFSAEYGNALSGVVNLTTRSGHENYSGSFEFGTTDLFRSGVLTEGQGSTLDRQNYQWSIGGPIPGLGKRTDFFVSGEVTTQTGEVYKYDDIIWDNYKDLRGPDIDIPDSVSLPSSDEVAAFFDDYVEQNPDLPPSSAVSVMVDSMGELFQYWKEVRGPDGRKINPFDRFAGWQGFGWDNSYDFFGKFNFQVTDYAKLSLSLSNDQRYRQINNRSGAWIYGMRGQNIQLLGSNRQVLKLNHALSSNTFYTLITSRFVESRRIRVLSDYDNKFSSNLNVFAPDFSNIKDRSDYIAYAGEQSALDPFESQFYIIADNRYYSGDSSMTLETKFDVTSQLTDEHQFKAGLQYRYLDIIRFDCQNISSECKFPTDYRKFPKEAAVYLMDKMEFVDLVVNVGGRVDYSNSGGDFWTDPLDPLGEQDLSNDDIEYNSITASKQKMRFSPRIGIAYQLTDKSKVHFNFGHFFMNPNYRDLFRASGDAREISLIQGNIIGNPNLENEKSVQYEVGYQQQMYSDYGLTVNLWLKETTNQLGSIRVPSFSDEGGNNPYTYSVFVNNNFGSARGIDMSMEKRYSHNFSGRVDYTWSQSRVYKPTSWDGYWDANTKAESPKGDERSPWDQPHVIRANVRYKFPDSYGLGSGSFSQVKSLLSGLGVTALYYGESGYPYTPIVDGEKIIEPLSERWPFFHQFDTRLFKEFTIGGLNAVLFSEVKNILNRANILDGYERTGDPYDPGTSTYNPESGRSSTYWDSRNNNNFAAWRQVDFGIVINF